MRVKKKKDAPVQVPIIQVPIQVPQVPEPSIQNMLEVEAPTDDESWLTNLDIDGIVAHILTQPMQVAEQIPLTSQPPRDEDMVHKK